MLQHAVALLLQRLLGKIVSFDPSMLRLSLWQGDLSFQDLQLRLGYGTGSIGELSVKIPWRSLWNQPVVIKAKGIRIFAHHNDSQRHTPVSTKNLSTFENINTSSTEYIDQDQSEDRTYISKLVSHIIGNVQIELSDVQIRYDCMKDSLAKLPGSLTIEIGQVNLMNCDAQWNLVFTPDASSGMESRKLLKTESISAYIEYHTRKSISENSYSDSLTRKYIFHEWFTTAKASLFYHSSNAAFPDVELDLELGCAPVDEFKYTCSICEMWEDFHRHRHEPVTDEQKVIIQQPRIHFGSDHIDVLYAILIEVKAPYDEYDRLSLLTQKQKSRPEGFLMVLTYAKQWLLADCLEGVTSTSGDSDDDEDEFEDAITPPTLSLAARLEIGMNIILVSREYTSSNPNRKWWRFVVGKTIASIKQSCVEDEINVYLDSLSLQEMRDAQVLYHILLSEDSTMDHFPYLEFSCVIPAYQSRLVGHQPSTELHMRRGVHFKLKDETLVTWMALLAPMWTWWNQWNLTHPSKQLLQQLPSSSLESFRVAPIAKRSIEIKCIHIQYFIHDDLSFGIQLEGIQVTTVEDEEQVVSSYSMNKFRIFSVEKATASTHRSNFRHHSSNNKASTLRRATGNAVDGTNESTEAVHEILVAERLVLRESSHSRTKWSQAAYECQHQRNDDYDDVPSEQPTMSLVRDTSCSISYPDGMLVAEIPMYAYEVLLPSINVSLHVEEIESLCWVIGKWSYYLVESTDDDQSSANPTEPVNSIELELDSLASGSRRKDFCRLRWTVAIPDIIVNLSQQDYNTSSDIELPKLCLILEELNIQSHECSRHRSHRITASSVRLQESKLKVFTIPYASSGPAITLSHSHRTKLFRNTTNARDGGFYLSSNDELNVTMERSLSLLSTDFIHILLGWTDTWSLHYDVGMMFSSSWGYDLDTLKRNVMRIKEPVENFPGVSLASKKAVQSKKRRNFQLNVFMPKGLMLTILHADPVLKRPESEIFVVECTYGSISSLSRGSHRKMKESSTRGTLRNVQIRDMTFPLEERAGSDNEMLNRHFICSNQNVMDGSRNVVDFLYSWNINVAGRQTKTSPVLQLRLESVCIVYLHRVYKQLQHYLADHFFPALSGSTAIKMTAEIANKAFKRFQVDEDGLPVSVDEVAKIYCRAGHSKKLSELETEVVNEERSSLRFELVANDLCFTLPRNSFSSESIVLRSTNAKLWSSEIDPSESDFLQTGYFGEEARLPTNSVVTGASVSRAQQLKRTELRNLRRLVKNQRSRLLSNRSQLYVDLKNATQQAQNYLHEGIESLPDAEEAVRILQARIGTIEKQLDLLNCHLKDVDAAIELAKSDSVALGSTRDTISTGGTASSPVASTTRIRSESMDVIWESVLNMPQHLIGSLFVADNAEFYDARLMGTINEDCSPEGVTQGEVVEADVAPEAITGYFDFELVDLSGSTSHSMTPLFHHALLTGRIESEPERLHDGSSSSYLGINLSLNELSVGATPEQYETLMGMIFENFKEFGSAVNEDTYPLCANCGGHHYTTDKCHVIWMRILIKVADAALRISSQDQAIADFFFEKLELRFIMCTHDSLEMNVSSLSMNIIDVRPSRPIPTSEILRPLPGEGLQIQFNQNSTWTDTIYTLNMDHTNIVVAYEVMQQIFYFFVAPFWSVDIWLDYEEGFMPSAPPVWKKSGFQINVNNSWFCLLEDFAKVDSRALVFLANFDYHYLGTQLDDHAPDMQKSHLSIDQRGVYFSSLPELQIDVSFPVVNSVLLVFDQFLQWSMDRKSISRRNSFVLEPVEARFSVQDCKLFINILNTYLKLISSGPPSKSYHTKGSGASDTNSEVCDSNVSADFNLEDATSSSSADLTLARSVSAVEHSKSDGPPTITYSIDKLLGDVGEMRLVLVNNSLGIPIADFRMTDIVCEYIQEEDCSMVFGGVLSFNYFNNRIYRWEPLVEPFIIQMRVQKQIERNSRMEVFVNLPNTMNLNFTPAMAPLLSFDTLKQADFVTTGSKSTAPFWIHNKTGMEIKFSFRRGKGNLIQQVVSDDYKVPVDCRGRGDMRSFDTTSSSDRFAKKSDRSALTVNHTLSVWLNGNKWVSINPVIVDVVGHVSVPLREVTTDTSGTPMSKLDELHLSNTGDLPPVLVAEISIQSDGSKLINLHSQVVLQNRTSVPLMVWAFSPREGGIVKEWVIDREEVCHIPLRLIHPSSKISIRPSPYVQYAPLATSLEELNDETRVSKSSTVKRFIRAGACVCNFKSGATTIEVGGGEFESSTFVCSPSSGEKVVIPLSGYLVRDLPPWRCTYDVEAYSLMRATFSSLEEIKPSEKISEIQEEKDEAEEDFSGMFSSGNIKRRLNDRLNDINSELDEARGVNQRHGMYEATNTSLYHLSVSPFMSLHNRLASAVAYRLLNSSLQLIAEGILPVGSILPLFQVDGSSLLFISFRLENYNWSAPKVILNPKSNRYSVPYYKEVMEPVVLVGRVFNREVVSEQGDVPNIELQLKLSGRDLIVFCSIWIVNHSGLCLEYCNSISSSSKKLESMLKYVHERPTAESLQSNVFATRSVSYHEENGRDMDEVALTRLQKKNAAVMPVALIIVVQEAKELYNSQFFGVQSPYVRVSLYAIKKSREAYTERPEMELLCLATTKPSPSGGTNPKWDGRLHNTILLRFPKVLNHLDKARLILEVRNVRYGMDTCLGITAISLASILKNPHRSANFNWYKLMKKKSSADKAAANSAADSNTGTDSSTTNQSHVQRGQICVSFSVGTSQELQSKMEIFASVESPRPEPSLRESLSSPMGSENFDLARDVDDIMESESVENSLSYLPASGAVRSIQKLQAPATALSFLPATGDNRQNPVERGSRRAFALGDLESNRAQGDSMPPDPMSTRAVMNLKSHASPSKKGSASGAGGKVSYIRVYLPVNRFVFVTVEVASSSTLADVFQAICIKCGFQGIVQVEDFDFYELLLPRFVSVRSAGRPESERWYGKRLNMDAKLGKSGRKCGLHLCHRMAMTTIRLYDDTSTASYHHATPRSLIASAKKNNPAQNRPMEWGEVLLYGSGGKNWDVLRLKSEGSPWSEVVRLNRNAMGNSGVAQVITLTSENLEVTDETSLLRKSQYEVALWSSYGSGRFSETIIATLVPRYVLINCTGESIKYRQDLVPSTSELPPNELKPFHWTSWIAPKFLQVTFSHGQYGWSSRFRINSIGTTYLKLRKSIDQSQIYILQCQIEMVGGTIALVFREESKRWPPYRIDNSTSFRIQFRQAHWSAKDARFDELGPRSTCPYSWDSHDGLECSSATTVSTNDSSSTTNFSNRLIKIRFMRVSSSAGQGIEAFQEDAWMETREYNLDQMSSHKRIQLLRSLPPQLFLKPEKKGFLLKRDNLLKWNKKYFRLYDQMLYYFASEEDQELLGVIDLRSGSSNGSVAIYEKSSDGRAVASGSSGGGGLISLNGFVNSISETIFGSTSALRNGGKGGRNRSTDEDDDDERASRLVQIAVSMTTSSYLCEKSEQFVSAKLEEATAAGISKVPIAKRGFFINSHDLVEFLIDHQHAAHQDQAFVRAQEMILLGVICQVPKFLPGPGKGKDITTSPRENQPHHFQWSKSSWYCVNSINLSEDTDSMDDSGDEAGDVLPPTVLTKSNISSGPQHQKKKTPMPPNPARPTVPPSTHFSIITASKMYELKAKTPSLARSWVSSLKRSIREGAKEHSAATIENDPESIGNNIATTAQGNANANAKTYVHVRVRADGPTKVLELFEGGEEDVDEKELVKSELSSNLSVASLSPTASDVSTVTGHPTSGALSHGGIAIHLRMNSFGISCVNDIPMELMYIYLSGVNVHFSRIQHKMRLKMTLDDIQIDNQNPEATFPKLLCPRIHSDQQKKQLEQQQIEIIEEGIDEESSNTIHESAVEESEESINRRLMADHNFFTCADCKYRQLDIAAMHFCCTWSNEAGSKTEYFEHCSFWLYPLVIQLDEEFVNVTRSFLTLMTQSWDKTTSSDVSNNNTQAKNKNERSRKSIPKETMNEALLEFQETTLNEELDPLYGLYSYLEITSASEKRKIYFALLHIHPIECDITYRSDVLQITSTLLVRETSTAMVGMMMTNTTASSNSQKQQELKRAVTSSNPLGFMGPGSGSVVGGGNDSDSNKKDSEEKAAWVIPSLSMHVPDLDNAPVRLNALMIEHAFGTSGELTRRVSKYYTRQLWKQLHKILGSFDFLGNPVGFLDHIGTGVRDFVYEPLEGLKVGGKGFRKGLAKGTASLVSNTLDGTFDAASKISGTFGQGLAKMSLDDHYQQVRARARRHHVRGVREGLIQGSKELSLGVYEGVTGLVMGPMRGAQENGALGFVKGTITGIIGLPVKPVAGLFDFASRASQGVRNRSLQHGKDSRRVRRPRVFGRYNELKCYKEDDAIAYDLLKKTAGTKLKNEKIIFYFEVIQSVPAIDITKEAREKNKKTYSNSIHSLRTSLGENSNEEKMNEEDNDDDIIGHPLVYEVIFYEKKLGLDLETDFYCENVTIKNFNHEQNPNFSIRIIDTNGISTPASESMVENLLVKGDCLIGVSNVDIRGIGFHETLSLIRGASRPITLQFESCEQHVIHQEEEKGKRIQSPVDKIIQEDDGSKLKVQLIHWLIVTEQRVLYINVGSFTNPFIEWMTPLRYVYKVDSIKSSSSIYLHLSVGVDSLPTGPRLRPSWKHLQGHERDMEVFLNVMWHSFGTATAEEQELWPSDTSVNGFLLKKGGFSTVKRWFVLSRNCLYYFSTQDKKTLRGIIPLGNVKLETTETTQNIIRISNAQINKPLVTLQMDNEQVIEKVQNEIILMTSNRQELEMWSSSLAQAAGKGLRHARSTRFFKPNAASRLEIGCKDTPDFIVAALVEALKKTVDVFSTSS